MTRQVLMRETDDGVIHAEGEVLYPATGVYSGTVAKVPAAAWLKLPWAHDGGATLLSLTDPKEPTVLDTGIYALTGFVEFSEASAKARCALEVLLGDVLTKHSFLIDSTVASPEGGITTIPFVVVGRGQAVGGVQVAIRHDSEAEPSVSLTARLLRLA